MNHQMNLIKLVDIKNKIKVLMSFHLKYFHLWYVAISFFINTAISEMSDHSPPTTFLRTQRCCSWRCPSLIIILRCKIWLSKVGRDHLYKEDVYEESLIKRGPLYMIIYKPPHNNTFVGGILSPLSPLRRLLATNYQHQDVFEQQKFLDFLAFAWSFKRYYFSNGSRFFWR